MQYNIKGFFPWFQHVLDSVNYGSLKLKSLTPDVLTRTSEFPIPILWQLPHKEMGTRIICASCVVPLIRMMELSLQSCIVCENL